MLRPNFRKFLAIFIVAVFLLMEMVLAQNITVSDNFSILISAPEPDITLTVYRGGTCLDEFQIVSNSAYFDVPLSCVFEVGSEAGYTLANDGNVSVTCSGASSRINIPANNTSMRRKFTVTPTLTVVCPLPAGTGGGGGGGIPTVIFQSTTSDTPAQLEEKSKGAKIKKVRKKVIKIKKQKKRAIKKITPLWNKRCKLTKYKNNKICQRYLTNSANRP